MKLRLALVLAIMAAAAAPAAAQPAHLVKDLNTGGVQNGSYPRDFAALDDVACFTAETEPDGRGTWRSDGTEAGTTRILRSQTFGATVRVGQWLVFSGGSGLWRTDCTAGGTTLVKDLSASIYQFVTVNGQAFFIAYEGSRTRLWKTDGTEAGTQPLAELPPAYELTYAAGHFFFLAPAAGEGDELWKTDGTDASTMLVKDVRPGPRSAFSSPLEGDTTFTTWLHGADHMLFFAADDGVHGMELWRSDGTPDGTTLVTDIVPGPADGVDIVNHVWLTSRDVVYFQAHGGNLGKEPWRSDGTASGTRVIADLAAGPSGSFPNQFTVFGDRVVFTATATGGPGIWTTNGSGPGVVLLEHLAGYSFSVANDSLFFSSGNGADSGFFRSDGTPGGAVLIKPVQAWGPLVAIPGGFLFPAYDPMSISGVELWRTDGTPAGTRLLKNINPDQAWGAWYGRTLASFNGTVILTLDTYPEKIAFRSDGTAAGTTRFAIADFSGVSHELNGRLIFGRTVGNGEVWSTDGTAAGMVRLATNLRLGGDFAILNGQLFFTASVDSPTGLDSYGIWRTDGTSAGTVRITDPAVLFFDPILVVNQALYFFGYGLESNSDGAIVGSLWRSDGSPAGTTRIAVNALARYSGAVLTDVNGTLFFAGRGGLWKSNRTTAGTGLLKGIPGTVRALTNMDGTLMFVADDGVHGNELWRSDGTEAGTVLVRDINSGPSQGVSPYGSPSALVAIGHQVIFQADDGTHGAEPWRSDGTPSGTVLLKDVAPGPASSFPQALAAIDGMVLFSADDGVHGFELWRSDGSAAGTVLMQDIAPGDSSSKPADFIAVGPHIFFTAHTPDHGRELWVMERAPQFYPCTIAVVHPALSIGANGGGRRIGITATAGCIWTVTTSSPWATVVSGTVGAGDGGATVNVARNTSGSPRTLTLRVNALTVTIAQGARNRAAASDFDGDARGDVSVWRPATGDWWSQRSSTGGGSYLRTHWGAAGDVPVAGDYDGDGAWDLAVFRPSNGTWYVKDGATVEWGSAGAIPVPGDYDGDGVTDIAVFDPGKGLFLIRNAGTIAWGAAGDIPVPADYNGDGITDIAVYRPSTGTWYIRNLTTAVWGIAGDIPVAADFNGDGSADIAVFRPSSGVWYVMNQFTATWGAAGDIPVALDRDGDGLAELGIFRRATGTWYFQSRLTQDIETVVWGAPGDVPLGRQPLPSMTIAGDVDGDRKADLTVFRPSTSDWRSLRSLNGMTDSTVQAFGTTGDLPVSRDYDGDGQSDVAVFRPSTGWWYVLRSSTGGTAFTGQAWGLSGDMPVPGDYDGDGKADFAVFRPSTGRWAILLSSTDNSSYASYDFGIGGDVPVPADYDGDGRIDIAVFRPSSGRWYVLDRATGGCQSIDWGLTGDVPAPADFDGDGKADLAVFRPSLGQWFIQSSIDGTYQVVEWGLSGDVMVPADFNGDGKADVAVFRPSTATWYVRDQFTRVWHSVGDTAAIKVP